MVRVASSVQTVVLLAALGRGCEAAPDRGSSPATASRTAWPSKCEGSDPFQPTDADRDAISGPAEGNGPGPSRTATGRLPGDDRHRGRHVRPAEAPPSPTSLETYGVAEALALADEYREIPGDDADVKTGTVLRRALDISEAQLVSATWEELATLLRG